MNLVFVGDDASASYWETSVSPYLLSHFNFSPRLLSLSSLSSQVAERVSESLDNVFVNGREMVKFVFGSMDESDGGARGR